VESGRVGSCHSQILVGRVGSVGYWVGSDWVKKFGPTYISALRCVRSASVSRASSPLRVGHVTGSVVGVVLSQPVLG